MYFNREYSLEYLKHNIYNERFIILTSNIDNPRSQKLIKAFPSAKHIDISYSLSMNKSGMLSDSFFATANFKNSFCCGQYHSLYQDLRTFVKSLHEESSSLIIDISCAHLRFLGALLATMAEWKWKSIICAYAEPSAYPRTSETIPVGDSVIQNTSGFDLNSSFWGYDEIPNLKTITSKRENYIWIVFLGFEGKRSAAIYTEISDDASLTIPVITIPSVRPGWANYAFDANQMLFENAHISCSDIEYINALDPFATYNFIARIQENHKNRHLVISPLSTRPVSLGVLLFAMKHDESEIYFDTPKESCSKLVDSSTVHFYDILSFFEEVEK